MNSGVWEGKLISNIHWMDVQNCIVDSSTNNMYVIRGNIFLHACKYLSEIKYPKGYSYDNHYLLLICSDIKQNPGGTCRLHPVHTSTSKFMSTLSGCNFHDL